MKKDARVSLAQILERGDRIAALVLEGRVEFLGNVNTQDAVIRNFEVIGEAARRVPQAFRDQHPGIPWERLNAFRNVLIHRYDEVDLEEVWDAAAIQLPPILLTIRNMLPPLDQLEREVAGEIE